MRALYATLMLMVTNITPAGAYTLSLDECLEGSEFILHAAMSRDQGMTRDDFVGRVHADLAAIQQFPPELRWFAQDEEDAALLVHASEKVFDQPQQAREHQADFLETCVRQIGAQAKDAAPPHPAGVSSREDSSL